MGLVFCSWLERCQQLLYTCVSMLSFVMVWASSPFFGFASNSGFRVGNDGFCLSFLDCFFFSSDSESLYASTREQHGVTVPSSLYIWKSLNISTGALRMTASMLCHPGKCSAQKRITRRNVHWTFPRVPELVFCQSQSTRGNVRFQNLTAPWGGVGFGGWINWK